MWKCARAALGRMMADRQLPSFFKEGMFQLQLKRGWWTSLNDTRTTGEGRDYRVKLWLVKLQRSAPPTISSRKRGFEILYQAASSVLLTVFVVGISAPAAGGLP
jgi:hypothetical protein